MNFPEYQHRFQATRPYPSYGPKAFIKVDAHLHYLKGNSRPYFAVGAEIWEGPRASDCVACGCLHDEVLKMWPQLAPIVALHLSADEGVPMHAQTNGWHSLAGYYGGAGERYHAGNSQRQIYKADGTYEAYRCPTPEECLQFFADHVRLPLSVARDLAESWRADDDPSSMKRGHREWIATQGPRWKAEADMGIRLLDMLKGVNHDNA